MKSEKRIHALIEHHTRLAEMILSKLVEFSQDETYGERFKTYLDFFKPIIEASFQSIKTIDQQVTEKLSVPEEKPCEVKPSDVPKPKRSCLIM